MKTLLQKYLGWALVAVLALSGYGVSAVKANPNPPAREAQTVAAALPAYEAGVRTFTVNTASITADTYFTGTEWIRGTGPWVTADVYLFLDQTTVNTATIYMQTSPDASNWVTTTTVIAASAVDTQTVTAVTMTGRYMRFFVDVTNSNPYTPTIKFFVR